MNLGNKNTWAYMQTGTCIWGNTYIQAHIRTYAQIQAGAHAHTRTGMSELKSRLRMQACRLVKACDNLSAACSLRKWPPFIDVRGIAWNLPSQMHCFWTHMKRWNWNLLTLRTTMEIGFKPTSAQVNDANKIGTYLHMKFLSISYSRKKVLAILRRRPIFFCVINKGKPIDDDKTTALSKLCFRSQRSFVQLDIYLFF